MHFLPLLVAIRVGVLATGSLLTLLAFYKYLQSSARDHLLLSVGFGLIATGALVEGVLFEFFRLSLAAVHTIESTFSALGLSAILLAILLSRR